MFLKGIKTLFFSPRKMSFTTIGEIFLCSWPNTTKNQDFSNGVAGSVALNDIQEMLLVGNSQCCMGLENGLPIHARNLSQN